MDDSAHCMRIHGIVPWDGQNPDAVRHDNVLALPGNQETGLLKSPNRAEMRDSGYLRHALRRNFHFPQVPLSGQFLRHFQVIPDGVANIRQRFLFGGALRPATGKSRTGYAVPFFGPRQGYRILHAFNLALL